MRVRDGLWIAATIVLVPIIGIFGGYLVGACLALVIIGAITLPVWLPLYLLARWALWKSPQYRAGVFTRFWLREKISDWRSGRAATGGARRN
ncbi:MAG TPA: hypothetical protein VFI32_03230 [Rhodanobacteraceae bacterium]|nr:hypothetical protein [Rhodanobacteraceae bacterium]